MTFGALLLGAVLMHGCGASQEDARVAAAATQGPIVPAGWKGPGPTYLHDTMTECLVHEGVMPSCPPQFPKRVLSKMSDAGHDPYTYEVKGEPVTLCCL